MTVVVADTSPINYLILIEAIEFDLHHFPTTQPATYIGFYDNIRDMLTQAPLAARARLQAGRFGFNVKGGHYEECQGEGMITTRRAGRDLSRDDALAG